MRITPTDKSSRMAVMTYDQYINAGLQHTLQDEEIDWAKVRYLQNQTNNHVWWISRILGYSLGTDSKTKSDR